MSESTKEIGGLVRELYSAINKQDMDALARVFADDVDYADFGLGQKLKGKEAIRNHFRNWWTAFPKGTGEVVSLIASGDQIIAEIIGRGEQTGPFETSMGRVEPSNQAFEFHFCQLYRIEDGKIADWRTYSDVSLKIGVKGLEKKAA